MLKPMFGHRPKNKKFNYKFRYYDPIERKHRKSHQGRSVLLYALGLALVVWIISVL